MDSLRAAFAAFLISLAAALFVVSPGARRGARPVDRLAHRAALAGVRQRASADCIAGGGGRDRRRNLPHPAVRRHAERHLDARDRSGADRDHRRRRQGGRLRHHVPDFDRAIGSAVRRRDAGCAGARLRPRLSARAGDRGARGQGRARPGAALRSSGAAVARPARRGRTGPQHPRAQRPQRSRRRDPPPAAVLHRRRRESALDGESNSASRAMGGKLPTRHSVRHRAEHGHTQFRRRLRRHPDLLAGRSARLRRARRQGILPQAFRRQGRAAGHRARRRRPQDHVEALRHRRRRLPRALRRNLALLHAGVRARLHSRRLYPRHGGEQPDPRRNADRVRAPCHVPRRACAGDGRGCRPHSCSAP